jgi:hypothetical protein
LANLSLSASQWFFVIGAIAVAEVERSLNVSESDHSISFVLFGLEFNILAES